MREGPELRVVRVEMDAVRRCVIPKLSYETGTGQTMVRMSGREDNGAKVNVLVSGCPSYFYVDEQYADRYKGVPEVVSVMPGPKNVSGGKTVRIQTRFPYDVAKIRGLVPESHEADIVFVNRVRADHQLSYVSIPDGDGPFHISQVKAIPPFPATFRVIDFDIETDGADIGELDPEHPTGHVEAISFYDSGRNRYGIVYHGPEVPVEDVLKHVPRPLGAPLTLYSLSGEHDVLGAFGELLGKVQPDLVSAFNGYSFDDPYLAGRAKECMANDPENEDLQLLYDCFDEDRARAHGRFARMDTRQTFIKQEMRTKDTSLESVATELLGYGKVSRPSTIAELQKTNPALWLAYSVFDTHLTRMIREKREMVGYVTKIAFLAAVEVQDILHNSRIVDGTLLQEARNNECHQPEIVLPSKGEKPPKEETARAALVFDPVGGIHEAVPSVDLAQTYPCIMRTLNISPETFVPNPIPGETNDVHGIGSFRKVPEGLIPRALRRMMTLRYAAKARVASLAPGSPEAKDAETLSQSTKYILNCLPPDTMIATSSGPKRIVDVVPGDSVFSYTEEGPSVRKVLGIQATGTKPVYKMRTKLRTIRASGNHPFLTAIYHRGKDGCGERFYRLEWKPLESMKRGDLIVVSNNIPSLIESIPSGFELQAIRSIVPDGEEETYDIEVEGSHNFIADGVVVHNSYTGVTKEKHWRLRNKAVFESVTAPGRLLLQHNRDCIEDPAWFSSNVESGCSARVIHGHTDSCRFVIYDDHGQVTDFDRVVAIAKKTKAALNSTYPEFMKRFNVTGEQFISVDLEGVFDVLVLPKLKGGDAAAKTRYYGTWAWLNGKDMRSLPFEARKKIMGLEIKRFNNSPITKEVQTKGVELVCAHRAQEFGPYYEAIKTAVMAGRRDEDLLIPTRVGKETAKGPNVRAMENASNILGMRLTGDSTWRWAYTRRISVNGREYADLHEFAIPYSSSLKEMVDRGVVLEIDRPAMFKKCVEDVVESVIPDFKGSESAMGEEW